MLKRLTCGLAVTAICAAPAAALELDNPDVAAFIDTMVEEHDFERETVRDILSQAEKQQTIIDRITKPAEGTMTWGQYRKLFLNKERIEAGAAFWRENEATLARIAAETGVPERKIVAIIGVETYFGRLTGGHRVLDALSTLAFYYPRRSAFFTRELEQFLLLVREEEMSAADATGSYAGAMGRPQFMPSSFRAYAVDGSGDGKRDIWGNWADAASSVANYFVKHGWKPGEDVVAQATLSRRWQGPVPKNQLKTDTSVGALSEKGAVFATDLELDAGARLLTLDGADGAEHWVGFHNFFVITRYNRSVMYALAVHQLGEAIAAEVQSSAVAQNGEPPAGRQH